MRNGKDISLNDQSAGLTDVSDVLPFDMQNVHLAVVTAIMIRGYPQETATEYDTQASVQPMPQNLVIKKEGERDWQWWVIRILPDITVNTDDKLIIGGKTYRVMSKMAWAQYGYQELECIEDYQNA